MIDPRAARAHDTGCRLELSATMLRNIIALIIAFECITCGPAFAAYPERPVRLIVGYAGGDTTDLIARVDALGLADFFKQPFLVENHPGANGTLAIARVAKAKPDGYTLLLVSSSFSTSPGLYPGLAYQPTRDFVPVSRIAYVHNVLVVGGSVGVRTLADFIAAVRSNPGKMIFASGGTGSASHLAAELLKMRAGPLNTLHVPYKGIGPALAELLGGHVDALFLTLPYAYPHVKSGRIRALAVASLKRAAQLPDVPTFDESGIGGFEAAAWSAIAAPIATPYDTVVRLNLGVTNLAGSATVKERLAGLGAEPLSETSDQFAAYLRTEVEKWSKVIKGASITLD
jgi:tripartite-type tricarboxylate transporter receptor subunit TctC